MIKQVAVVTVRMECDPVEGFGNKPEDWPPWIESRIGPPYLMDAKLVNTHWIDGETGRVVLSRPQE